MTIRDALITVRDWTALIGAVAMVGFLTFVPRHASVERVAERIAPSSAAPQWPSRTAGLQAVKDAAP